MLNQPFVSIYFGKDCLQVVSLDQKKYKVKNICSAKIPSGTIKNNTVVDTKIVSKIISDIWSKTKINEKFVSLIIPEYSTFIKTVNLPNIELSEIKEALSWNLQEILPTPPEKTVVDWKIIAKNEKGYEVLVVSVEKSVLDSYLTPVEDAGLLPLMVEIPSVSLSKLIDSKEETQILIYVGSAESVFLFQSEGKLIGSSIVFDDNPGEIVKTAKRMVLHYDKFKVNRILLAGDIKNDLQNNLSESIKAPVDLIDSKFSNVEESIIKKYLIPISSQMQKPNIPEDPFSINLLPDNFVSDYKNIQSRLQVWSLTLASSLFVWIAFLGTLFSYLIINENLKNAKINLTNTPVDKNSIQQTVDKIANINKLTEKVMAVKTQTDPTKLLNEIFSSKPDGITINSYDIDFDKGLGIVSGIALDRNVLVKFRNDLDNLEIISSAELPVSSFEMDTNLEYQIKFSFSEPVTQTSKIKVDNIN